MCGSNGSGSHLKWLALSGILGMEFQRTGPNIMFGFQVSFAETLLAIRVVGSGGQKYRLVFAFVMAKVGQNPNSGNLGK